MKYPIGTLIGLYNGTLFLNIDEYSTFEIAGQVLTTEWSINSDDSIEKNLTDTMMEGEWFINLIFEGIEEYDPYE